MDWQVKQTDLLKALDPQSIAVDERSVVDCLSFAARYSELVLFYDKFNRQQGNWRAFFLKDPVILMATISKTDYRAVHRQYVYLTKTGDKMADERQTIIALCELVKAIFVDINDWLIQLDNDFKHFHLKAFIKQNVAEPIAAQMALFIGVVKKLTISHDICCQSNIALFAQFMPLWRSRPSPVGINAAPPWDSLLAIYETLFAFYVQVIDNAESTYVRLKEEINHYPDTALLIAFVQLLDIHRQQLNGMTARHLDFYYQDILKQQPAPEVADEVTLLIGLNDNCDSFEVTADIHFEGPADEDGQHSVFAVERPQKINRGKISQVRVLHCDPTSGTEPCVTIVEQPDMVGTNLPDEIPNKPLYPLADATPLKPGFVIASPTLFMQGGDRTLTVTFDWTLIGSNGADDCLTGCEVFLSNENGWFKVAVALEAQVMTIALDHSAPPVESFGENDQGIPTQWPLLKVVLSECTNLTSLPELTAVTIEVVVKQAKGLVCHNNDGGLDSDSDFMPFGPIATLGNRFYIEAAELLAKPLQTLDLTFHWAELPPDFAVYYQQYNNYLRQQNLVIEDSYFNNECFKVDIRVAPRHLNIGLTDSHVSLFQSSMVDTPQSKQDNLINPLAPSKRFFCWEKLKSWNIFDRHEKEHHDSSRVSIYNTNAKSVFKCSIVPDDFSPMPELLHHTQAFSAGQQSGFIELELVQPGHEFGHQLYPKVIEEISQNNAAIQVRAALDKNGFVEFEQTANPPYAPIVQNLVVDYSAQTRIDITSVTDNEQHHQPCEFYHIDYFSGDLIKQDATPVPTPVPTLVSTTAALANFNVKNSTLYLALADLKPPCRLSFYFALTTQTNDSTSIAGTLCHYLTDTDWRALTVLNDQTNRLNHCGIIEVDIDADISCNNALMGTDDHWIRFNLDEKIISRITYINTQVISAKRHLKAESTDQRVTPSLSANSIDSTLNASEQIDSVEQPFASFNGKAAQSKAAFYLHVSQRIKTRDRASSQSDYATLALTADSGLYYCKVMPVGGGKVSLGLVDSCCNPAQAGAFSPAVESRRITALKHYIERRISPMVAIQVANLTHQPVKITAAIRCEATHKIAVFQQVNQALKLYLSPWINTVQPQVEINTELDEAAIYQFIAGLDGVIAVQQVELMYCIDKPSMAAAPDKDALMVSAPAHHIYSQEDTL